MKPEQLESYLERIGMKVPDSPSLEVLKNMQECHIYAIPVENLDIIQGNLPLSLEIDDLVDKVARRRRGGISFELNVLFAEALRDIGFDVRLMSAKHPKYGHEFDHAVLMVRVPGEEGEWLVDVGYTENFRTPLLFDGRIWQSDGRDDYKFVQDECDGEAWRLMRRRADHVDLVYSFRLKEHRPSEYYEQCAWFCTNPQSRFTQGLFVSIERPEGRICCSMDTVMNTYTGKPIRPVIEGEEDARAVLREVFGIEADSKAGFGNPEEKFNYLRIFAALGNDAQQDAVIEEAVRIALEKQAHLRFGHVVVEAARGADAVPGSFPAYVQSVRLALNEAVAKKMAALSKTDEVLGGEVVVMGLNSRIGATIDAPVGYAPEQLVESLIKPFNPAIVVCGSSRKSKLRSFIQGSTESYLARKLDCEVVCVE
ncbi:MAG TPA: hypothetical protein DCP91_05330 [Eggerthellaceae bacterium]|nr:hypothetical protein [Eggerthellaceae bacterium]